MSIFKSFKDLKEEDYPDLDENFFEDVNSILNKNSLNENDIKKLKNDLSTVNIIYEDNKRKHERIQHIYNTVTSPKFWYTGNNKKINEKILKYHDELLTLISRIEKKLNKNETSETPGGRKSSRRKIKSKKSRKYRFIKTRRKNIRRR